MGRAGLRARKGGGGVREREWKGASGAGKRESGPSLRERERESNARPPLALLALSLSPILHTSRLKAQYTATPAGSRPSRPRAASDPSRTRPAAAAQASGVGQ